MLVFLARRLMQLVPVVLGVSLIVFLMIHVIPGDPAQLIAGPEATPADIEVVRTSLGLDRSLPVQYLTFLGKAVTGDFGQSFRTGRPVIEEIGARYWNTLALGCVAMVFGTVLGLAIGVVTAVYRGTWIDNAVLGVSLLGISAPSFFLGILLMLLFSVSLQWLPLTGMGSWQNFIMPGLTLGIPNAAVIARMARTSLLEVLQQDYVRTAQAKGLAGPVVVLRHALRNALISVVTVVGLQMGYLLGGAVVTETVFAWPGIGRLLIQSISSRDFPVVQASVLILALTFVMITLMTDVLYRLVDPRIEIK
ncbi:ABC transporter permease [Bosea caraganae]|uniref:ABC transporter permease n=1 Tax=Bosea caraganae TaxID=2763117 RepID=A0A370LDH7_9HYPH|nr:ABC transporter permease [Bosea caraganae]RDJ27913.1 ABC transporter permease [Bosea caraganae]RDJ29928.1 ABC transporter permease [Bosea caraganae]